MLQDLSNNGMQNVKLHIKTDQEPSIVNVQTAMQELSLDHIIPLNSPVGESECNGRVENVIKRVQEKVRTLRHHVEYQIKAKIPDDAPIMSWLVTWSAELISKYAVGEDGKSPYGRIRKEDCVTPLVLFGETVLYLPLKTVHRNKGTPAKRMRIWLGVSERIEEVLTGTKYGVIKCRIVQRLDESERWKKSGIMEMKGAPWEPVIGKQSQHIPVDVADNCDYMGSDSENEEMKTEEANDEMEDKEYRINIDKFHVSQKAIRKFGTTSGCAACAAIKAKGDQPGRVGKHHSDECRKRIIEAMELDPQYRHLVQKLKENKTNKKDPEEMNMGFMDGGRTIATNPTTSRQILTQHISNVKKAIADIQAKIEAEKRRIDRNKGNNLGSQLNKTMLNMLINNMQVAEVYSPPRVVKMANEMGMRGGWSLDLTTTDEDGLPWDFNSIKMRNRATREIIQDKPLVVIGSPMCIEYSIVNRVNHCRMPKEVVEAKLRYARKHLEFCIRLYEIQWQSGRYFLHEHPDGAGSWNAPMMKKLMSRAGVQ